MTEQTETSPRPNGTPPAELVRVSRGDRTPYAVPPAQRRPGGPGARQPAGLNVWAIVQHGVRGRLRMAAGLGILLGVACGYAGWKIGHPTYHSAALLRVAYSMPKVFQETDQNEPMGQMFDTYMQSQKILIGSRRVIDMALADPVWKATGVATPENPDEYFIENLDVTIQPRSEFIQVAVSDTDPRTAAAAVTAIANGYAKLYHAQEAQLESQRTGALEKRQDFVRRRMESLRSQVSQFAAKYGTTALDTLHDAAMIRVARFDTARSDVRMAMLNANLDSLMPTDTDRAVVSPTSQPAQSPEQLALTDPIMRGYLDDIESLEKEQRRLMTQGLGRSHTQVIATARALDDARTRAQAYAAAPRLAKSRPLDDPRGIPLATAGKSLDVLQKDETAIVSFLNEAKADLTTIGNDRLALRQVETELASSQVELDQISKRLAALGGEASLGGRLTIVNTGEVPVLPDRDPRRKMAAMGLLGGFFLPAVVLTALAFVRPRYRYHDEAEADMPTRLPLLGILPSLDAGTDDASELTHRAAHSLHQLRVTLRSQSPRDGCCTYLVTSASPGEGKTSLVMSLALSFAASRLRTLVIDGDLVGRQLTNGLAATDVPGLYEALSAGTLRGLVRTGSGGVDFLTTGLARSVDACGLSPSVVDTLLNEAREKYDVVLIDSGPIMGSVEAAVFAPEVDRVIFAISRGQRTEIVRKAQQRLDTLGARTAGVVFNRAYMNDFQKSPFGSSSASAAWQAEPPTSRMATSADFMRFGPLVRAVAGVMPTAN